MRSERERLIDMHDAIEQIEKYASQGRLAFEQNELIQTWIVYHLQLLGEAARALPATLREQHPEIPWAQIIGTRNILVHHYFELGLDILWAVVEKDLPPLKRNIEAVIQGLDARP